MTCGKIDWWREPDLTGLLERHGQVEHLVVQFDFLAQAKFNGRAEFSIPGASKKFNGETGYADIVSITTGEIWEIKPRKLEDKAVKEATWYVENAKARCDPRWHAGESFTTKNIARPGLVYEIKGNGNKAELFAVQGQPGAVLYYWLINGKPDSVLERSFAWALRLAIVGAYFATSQTLQPLPGSKAPDNLPPGKFKPPVLQPGSCIPELNKFLKLILKSIRTTCAPTIFENGAVAILLEPGIYNRLVGPRIVANQLGSLQVKQVDPTVKLYRETLAILTTAGLTHGIVGAVIGLPVAFVLVIIIAAPAAPEVAGGGVIAFGVEATTAAGAPTVLANGVLGTLTTALSTQIRVAVAAGAAFLVLATPRASMADTSTPVALDVSLPKFTILTPAQAANARLGQSVPLDGAEWIIAGIATTPPD
ncbi:hypothetical protein [Rhodococcus wratislaviensis]|uniref:Uncharacterized protein n=1 Tax=Rhodococcus wratislaviensis NBRC 100605 TaxID=1219028 RepID=X0PRH1_RHOWR|nr:hypothetical protein [Rhodococcus wratislaviensis]GAF45489.1 hypothetical protein RW1_022_00660 [Rhodococcus wratislaviensis NBRC 100605]